MTFPGAETMKGGAIGLDILRSTFILNSLLLEWRVPLPLARAVPFPLTWATPLVFAVISRGAPMGTMRLLDKGVVCWILLVWSVVVVVCYRKNSAPLYWVCWWRERRVVGRGREAGERDVGIQEWYSYQGRNPEEEQSI
jgi:hypothetical protein